MKGIWGGGEGKVREEEQVRGMEGRGRTSWGRRRKGEREGGEGREKERG